MGCGLFLLKYLPARAWGGDRAFTALPGKPAGAAPARFASIDYHPPRQFDIYCHKNCKKSPAFLSKTPSVYPILTSETISYTKKARRPFTQAARPHHEKNSVTTSSTARCTGRAAGHVRCLAGSLGSGANRTRCRSRRLHRRVRHSGGAAGTGQCPRQAAV